MNKNLRAKPILVIVAVMLGFVVFAIDQYNTTDIHKSTLQGKILKVYDGDTITILDSSDKKHKIRLYGIDAPELKQSFGKEAQENLAHLCQIGQNATIEIKDRDRYQRLVGVAYCGNMNANKEQLKGGYAWAYTEYIPDPAESIEYLFIQEKAQRARLGLWKESNPIKPSEYRHNQPRIQTLPAM